MAVQVVKYLHAGRDKRCFRVMLASLFYPDRSPAQSESRKTGRELHTQNLLIGAMSDVLRAFWLVQVARSFRRLSCPIV